MSDARTGERPLAVRLAEFDTATLYEAAGQRGALAPGIHALTSGIRVAGPALTVACPPGDNLMLHAAIAAAQPGEIVVAQCHDAQFGVWGEVMTVAALTRGIAALVLDGSVRDVDAIRARGFPVFACGTALQATRKAEPGFLRAPISCGGLLVWPGDYVVADESGVVAIGADSVEAVLEAAQARREKEAAIMSSLREGRTTMELFNLQEVLNRLTQGRPGAPDK